MLKPDRFINDEEQKPDDSVLPHRPTVVDYSPNSHENSYHTLNVSRAIAFLAMTGIKARPVSFDEAVELCQYTVKLINGKPVRVPYYQIINVRHGLSSVRHYLDKQAEMGKRKHWE